jgi:alkanesulfonate monooxygenase SsuD/methylene tetrahydromethanopterin reductase-like flavin-dependent oxidoreductase (luciferase family)
MSNASAQSVAIYLQDAHTIREGMDFAKYAEAKGFDAVWQAESRSCENRRFRWRRSPR